MDIQLSIPQPFLDKTQAEMIKGFHNGCFTVVATDENGKRKLFLFNAKGQCLHRWIPALDAALLYDGSYFAAMLYNAPQLFDCLTKLYAPDGSVLKSGISDYEIFPNGWYRITINNRQELYRDDHILVVKYFPKCAVYENGFALRTNPSYYKYEDWNLFSHSGDFISSCRNVIAFLGNGFPLSYEFDTDSYLLYDETGQNVLFKDIQAFQSFPNGRFALTFEESANSSLSQEPYVKIFDADGTGSVSIPHDCISLPDGRFLHRFNSRSLGLYRRNGIITQDDYWWSVQLAGNYYLLHSDGGSYLFNDKGEDVGEGYELEDFVDNFALFENEGKLHLFNQYGAVLSLPYAE